MDTGTVEKGGSDTEEGCADGEPLGARHKGEKNRSLRTEGSIGGADNEARYS